MGPRGRLAIVALRTVARLPTSEFHQWRLLLREIGVRGPIGLNELAAQLDWNEPNTLPPLTPTLSLPLCSDNARYLHHLDFLPRLVSSKYRSNQLLRVIIV